MRKLMNFLKIIFLSTIILSGCLSNLNEPDNVIISGLCMKEYICIDNSKGTNIGFVVTNKTSAPIYYFGFDEGPIIIIEFKDKNGVWVEYIVRGCGTGKSLFTILPGRSVDCINTATELTYYDETENRILCRLKFIYYEKYDPKDPSIKKFAYSQPFIIDKTNARWEVIFPSSADFQLQK